LWMILGEADSRKQLAPVAAWKKRAKTGDTGDV